MCSGSPWNAFFPPDLFITFSVHPAKKGFFIFGKDYRDQNEASPFFVLFVLFEVIVQLCWHASLVQELILLSIRLLEQSTYIFLQRKKGVYLMKGFFLIRKEPLHFFYQRLLGAYFAVIQKMSRGQLLQACGRYFDDNWEATGTGRS